MCYNEDMNKQMSMSFLHDELKEVSTNKKEFLEQIERIMPWEELEKLIRPYYYEGKYGNSPIFNAFVLCGVALKENTAVIFQ